MMETNSNKKTCPNCYFINDDFVRVCMKCGHAFPKESIKADSDSEVIDEVEKEQPKTEKKPENPRAPKKTCPSCGAKVFINKFICPECNHHFEKKGTKTASSAKTHAQPQSKKEEIMRSPGFPIKSYIIHFIFIAIWFAICFFSLPWLHSKIGLGILIVDFIVFFVAIGLGMFFGMISSDSYGYRSSGYAALLVTCSVVGILAFDYFHLKFFDQPSASKIMRRVSAISAASEV